MQDKRLYKGYWWLPSRQEDQVAGVLTIESNGRIVLELLGDFGLKNSGYKLEGDDAEVIHGCCYAPNNIFKKVSLFHCHAAITHNFSSSFPLTRYTCRYALIGILVESMDDTVFFEADVYLDELANWCPPENIKTVYCKESLTLRINTTRSESAVIDTAVLKDGTKLKLKKDVAYYTNYPKISIEQSTCLVIHKASLSANAIISNAVMFEHMLSIAMLAYGVEHRKIIMRSEDSYQNLNDGGKFFHPIELVTYLYHSDCEQNHASRDFLFYHKDIQGRFSDIIGRLYNEPKINPIWNNLIISLENKRVYSTNDFLCVVQALDGFSLRFREEKSFIKQLQDLRNEFSNIDKLTLSDEELKATKGSRHYYSHILKLEDKEKKKALDGIELYHLTRKLKVLLICCTLNFLGFDNKKINQLFNKCNNPILDIS